MTTRQRIRSGRGLKATMLILASAWLLGACTPGAGATVTPAGSTAPASSGPASIAPAASPSGSDAGKGSY